MQQKHLTFFSLTSSLRAHRLGSHRLSSSAFTQPQRAALSKPRSLSVNQIWSICFGLTGLDCQRYHVCNWTQTKTRLGFLLCIIEAITFPLTFNFFYYYYILALLIQSTNESIMEIQSSFSVSLLFSYCLSWSSKHHSAQKRQKINPACCTKCLMQLVNSGKPLCVFPVCGQQLKGALVTPTRSSNRSTQVGLVRPDLLSGMLLLSFQ